MPQTSRNTAGTTSWTCPNGVRWVQAHAIGSGGAGGQRSSGNNSGAAGGRGGGYGRRHRVRVTPASSYNLTVGAVGTDGGSPANGAASSFVGDSSVTAQGNGGASCAANSQSAPATAGTAIGDVTFDGGAGGAGGGSSGGGGGGAGYAAVGGNASSATAGTGTTPGGDGATGRATTGVGDTATGAGGGGAGGRRGTSGSQDGGAGGPGLVLIRWLPPGTHMLLGIGS
jgi:hypothetical protein